MAGNITDASPQPRATVAATRMGRSRDRAQLAATLRWLRELRPVQRPTRSTRRPGGTTS